MDLISWFLNAINQFFSKRKQDTGESSGPDGILAGYIKDFGWNLGCLPPLFIVDTKVYLLGFMITGFLLFGVGGYLLYRKIYTAAAILDTANLPAVCVGMSRAVNTQTAALGELNRKLEVILVTVLNSGEMDSILEKFKRRSGRIDL